MENENGDKSDGREEEKWEKAASDGMATSMHIDLFDNYFQFTYARVPWLSFHYAFLFSALSGGIYRGNEKHYRYFGVVTVITKTTWGML